MNRKKAIRIVSSFVWIRILVRAIERALWVLSRLWSHLRFKALVPLSGDSVCHWTVDFQVPENIKIGDHVAIGPQCRIGAGASVIIEDYVTLSRGVVIETAGLNMNTAPPYAHRYNPITIKRGVWIATNAIILGGVTIGEGAVVGAGVVVTKDVPPGAVIVGAAPRLIRVAAGSLSSS